MVALPLSLRSTKEDIENGKYEEGWFYLSDGRPVRIDWDVNTTYSLKSFRYRTTLRTRYEEEQIVWEEMEFYECAEEWREKSTMVIVPEIEQSVVGMGSSTIDSSQGFGVWGLGFRVEG